MFITNDLITSLHSIFGSKFREQLESNFFKINNYLKNNEEYKNEHKSKEKNAHLSEQIKHDKTNVHNELLRLNGRIENQIIGRIGDNAEISDARVSIDGTNFPILESRLCYDLTRINKLAEIADELSKKHEEAINETAYYNEITYISGRKFDTSYKIVHIPHKDNEGNIIKLKRGILGSDKSHPEHIVATEFSKRSGATYVSNASTGSGSRLMLHGQQIYEGEILDSVKDYEPLKTRWTLAIGDDNTLEAFQPSVDAKTIKDKGYNNTVSGFGPLISNGEIAYKKGDYSDNSEESHPRQVICQLYNKDLLFFTCDGRAKAQGVYQKGMTLTEVIETLKSEYNIGKNGITFSYNLDGGGSSSSILRGRRLNKVTDNNNKSERKLLDFLYIGKEKKQPRDNDLQQIHDAIGDIRQDFLFLYGLYMNINSINNKELILSDGDKGYAGIVLNDSKGEPMTKLYLDTRLAFYNYKDKKSYFIADKDKIWHNDRMLGRHYSNPEAIDNCNNIQYGGDYQVLSSAKGSPYPGISSSLVTHKNIGSLEFSKATSAFQYAIPFSRSSAVKCKRRTYTKKDGWSEWFDF
ncbi:phosphodiester glycosidase family protein [Staphylococcus haemolyticus]|uniref:phosphodiester glycosidase family protein n=1 Tax=Staphylococcus haemolyticus TaxID=1283 RepID=UPI001F0A8C86|nr:phosphodiester glycosidase family protein [Staphylococcus haemolyticus]MCH4507210.1 phosphodiester glycosidase family protein [Staphylococcus haemolyticus]